MRSDGKSKISRGENYRLADLVDLELAQKMVDAHFRASGIPMGIIDALDGSILVSAGWQDICAKFHRADPVSRRRCEESDNYIKGHISADETCAYKCANGLWDIGIPIIVEGRHLATIFLGQFFYEGESPDREFFKGQARLFGYVEEDYLAALDRVPVLSRSKVDYILAYNKALSGFIANTAEHSLGKIRSEKELRFANALLKAEQEESPDGILVVDDEQNMISFNRKFVEMWGIAADVAGSGSYAAALRSARHLLADPDKFFRIIKNAYKHRERESFDEIAFRDGRIIEHFSAPMFGPDRAYYGRVWYFRDVTRWRQAEEILRRDKDTLQKLVQESAKDLVDAQIKVERSKRLSDIGTLASTIAHEIRNPLAAIKTAAYNIKRKVQDPRIGAHLANIDRKVTESDLIIQNLLGFAFVKEPRFERVALASLIHDCLETVLPKYAGGTVTVNDALPFTENDYIEADITQMRMLFLNVLDNAFQSLKDKKGGITLAGDLAGNRVEVRISDTGSGIDEEDLQRIFEPFFTRKSRGTGLGLTICRQIVEQHRGQLDVTSKVNSGTSVRIMLPARQV